MPVSGLAGFLDAAVMLTPTDSLHGGVADFLEDYGVDTIYVATFGDLAAALEGNSAFSAQDRMTSSVAGTQRQLVVRGTRRGDGLRRR